MFSRLIHLCHHPKSPLFLSESLSTQEFNSLNIQLGIHGEHQVENACLAAQLTDFWIRLRSNAQSPGCVPAPASRTDSIPGLKIRDLRGAFAEGLSTCVWHGRTQTISRERTTYYLDGAHTKKSLEVLKARWRLFGRALRRDQNIPANEAMRFYFLENNKKARGRLQMTLPVTLNKDLKKLELSLEKHLEMLCPIAENRPRWTALITEIGKTAEAARLNDLVLVEGNKSSKSSIVHKAYGSVEKARQLFK
ncbi:folylpolyglutamate synthase [Elysia marginata]|uniref:tetrahydrofolate synthase n=1 Tax=Elysia marginata TaxID=1093978 RepID=A0AAV4EA28_9GAST|nr:folylpolyglutamate synthase [Elysia marginata]